ncbi:MAG: hypothetical protein HY757_02990 [Nitrospirae bacterium]|nr:hypothetical protein [Nitrospirota bacterium]
MQDMVYKLKRSFQFRNSTQANAFLEIANIYGKGSKFGNVVIYEASLEFVLWRKLHNLAMIISACAVKDIDVYSMSSQAGFKVFSNAGT